MIKKLIYSVLTILGLWFLFISGQADITRATLRSEDGWTCSDLYCHTESLDPCGTPEITYNVKQQDFVFVVNNYFVRYYLYESYLDICDDQQNCPAQTYQIDGLDIIYSEDSILTDVEKEQIEATITFINELVN